MGKGLVEHKVVTKRNKTKLDSASLPPSPDADGNRPNAKKGPWTSDEDTMLLHLVREFGPKDWTVVASKIGGRVGKQCRERYYNHLAPEVRKDAWTEQEDDLIIKAHNSMGNKWTEISKILKGRPANAIKNRWNSTLKRRFLDPSRESGDTSPRQRPRTPGEVGIASPSHKRPRKHLLDASLAFETPESSVDAQADLLPADGRVSPKQAPLSVEQQPELQESPEDCFQEKESSDEGNFAGVPSLSSASSPALSGSQIPPVKFEPLSLSPLMQPHQPNVSSSYPSLHQILLPLVVPSGPTGSLLQALCGKSLWPNLMPSSTSQFPQGGPALSPTSPSPSVSPPCGPSPTLASTLSSLSSLALQGSPNSFSSLQLPPAQLSLSGDVSPQLCKIACDSAQNFGFLGVSTPNLSSPSFTGPSEFMAPQTSLICDIPQNINHSYVYDTNTPPESAAISSPLCCNNFPRDFNSQSINHVSYESDVAPPSTPSSLCSPSFLCDDWHEQYNLQQRVSTSPDVCLEANVLQAISPQEPSPSEPAFGPDFAELTPWLDNTLWQFDGQNV